MMGYYLSHFMSLMFNIYTVLYLFLEMLPPRTLLIRCACSMPNRSVRDADPEKDHFKFLSQCIWISSLVFLLWNLDEIIVVELQVIVSLLLCLAGPSEVMVYCGQCKHLSASLGYVWRSQQRQTFCFWQVSCTCCLYSALSAFFLFGLISGCVTD